MDDNADETELMDLTVVLYEAMTGDPLQVQHVTVSSVEEATAAVWPSARVAAVFEGHLTDLTEREEITNMNNGEKERYVVAFQSSIRRIDNKPFATTNTLVQYSPMFAHHDLATGWADVQAGVVLLKVNKRCAWSTEVKHSL